MSPEISTVVSKFRLLSLNFEFCPKIWTLHSDFLVFNFFLVGFIFSMQYVKITIFFVLKFRQNVGLRHRKFRAHSLKNSSCSWYSCAKFHIVIKNLCFFSKFRPFHTKLSCVFLLIRLWLWILWQNIHMNIINVIYLTTAIFICNFAHILTISLLSSTHK